MYVLVFYKIKKVMNSKTHYVYIYCDPRKKGVLSDDHRKKISDFRKKEVKQLDKNFNLVGLIHNVLCKSMRNISAGGFYWEYVNEENIKYNKLKNK